MARRHVGLPRATEVTLSKVSLLNTLHQIDRDPRAQQRVLDIETAFRRKIGNHVSALPIAESIFSKFSTSPFVLMMQSLRNQYSRISEIEDDILPAKLFSSMETSAGRMIEEIMLPIYGWECVLSEMHTSNSALDGKKIEEGQLKVATLKSGPRCLNDEMSENFADAIISHASSWAREANVTEIDFTYGVLYGTQKQSNKKDWHIIRNLYDKLGSMCFYDAPAGQWHCRFEHDEIGITATIRIGKDWWDFLGGQTCLVELCIALIRACVRPGAMDPENHQYTISDLAQIVSMSSVPDHFNSALLQRSQIPWLFFLARHFGDSLT
ncbi:PmeII family type II restriction endonuclease [Massilia orientalis]|uniref:PmeII family type II restriction endonuclease n=1 Tax=Massilia orientalis TaxID=3050128 RepID=A0ACC7MIE5_9BURK|nr:PmeII family type II restriction endonuclease [Massilia sp. YIM B02787]